ncbi:hypothetical protein [Micropruina glycogenica]|uniref:Lipoprotein n=1 Tax=Micropruina glycogenica TaxID=75385 RepID=A0A2N9JEM5_9ACTN|nr:hypothetical protein [Micropruina glycogenica]SPD85999.1 exported protein of unknown function [Micropruina glycogenica]
MHARSVLLATVAFALASSGCSAPAIGQNLGSIGYVRDKSPTSAPVTWVHAGSDIEPLISLVAGLGDDALTQRLRGVDRASQVVVTLYYDACAKSEPSLLTVAYGATQNRNCVRAVDTLVSFAVPRDRLPDPTTLRVCERSITIGRDGVGGEPIGLC